jgi:hypothetical protein
VEATEPHLLIASDEAHEAHEDRVHSDLHMGCRKLWDMVLIILIYPIWSMYGIFTCIWVIFGVNVGKYSIHGAYGYIYNLYILYGLSFNKMSFN